ncbi:hypothetical protein V2J09_019024 [Rumex salicifolius]
MQYFDLNIPYLEDPQSGKTTPSERAARKKTRLKLVVKAVELGYSGVAYNRSINGAMSEFDRCSASLFPLSNLLALSPSLSSSASFHRRLLSGPHASRSPFRQYTRITVSVDNPSQSSSLNSGNPILKTYDLVAVRPMNQVAFDQACQFSEVDLIAIDLSDKMPFRLKLPMVKAAIARGVYFEITYSSLIVDIQVRRQVISSAKLLVDWTRGKNLIVSSAAPSALEFRGPNDVANLLSLLGLAAEHAKAAISKNCRDLIAKTLRKKQFCKEAVKVDAMSSANKSDLKKPWIIDQMEWDPISSGEGDLLLEDLAKSFSEASKESEILKPNGFTSSMNNIASLGLKVTSLGAEIKKSADAKDNFAAFKEPLPSSETKTIRICSQRKPVSLSESEIVLTESVNTVVSSTASDSWVKDSDPLDIVFASSMMQEDKKSTYTQRSNILNTESVLKKCNNLEDDTAKRCDSEVSAHSKDVNFMSEATQPMMIDDINADPVLQNFTETSSFSQMDKKDQTDPSLIPSDCLIHEVSEIVVLDSDDEGKDGETLLYRDSAVKGGLPVDLNLGDETKDSYIMLDRDPAANSGLPVDEKIQEEVEFCKQETSHPLSTKFDLMSHGHPTERISGSNDLLIHDSGMDLEGEAHAEANYPSKIQTYAEFVASTLR